MEAMSFVTYILLVGVAMGVEDRFVFLAKFVNLSSDSHLKC
jgi:hypothetical protein